MCIATVANIYHKYYGAVYKLLYVLYATLTIKMSCV